uniref:Odorant-binding protein n=1 Tax=Anopheles funestus TaxID=62324 RepID=A0A182R7X9_ANOFN
MCNRELNPPRTEMVMDSLNFTVCFLDCAYRHMGYLKANNEIDVQAYVAFLTGFDKDYQLMISNAIAKCAEMQSEMQLNVDKMGLKCNMFAVLFQDCITIFTFRNCPAARWTNSKICNELKMGVPLCT